MQCFSALTSLSYCVCHLEMDILARLPKYPTLLFSYYTITKSSPQKRPEIRVFFIMINQLSHVPEIEYTVPGVFSITVFIK